MRILASLLAATMVFMAGRFAPLAAQEAAGDEGAVYLLLPVGPKGVSVARAMTALGGAESVWWNPAGLASVDGSVVSLTRSEDDISGESTALSALLHGQDLGVIGLSYLLVDLGEEDIRDAEGNFLGQLGLRYHTGILSASTSVLGNLAMGLNLKLIQSRQSCRGQCLDAGVTATTYAVDVGAQWRDLAASGLTLGLAVVHAGPSLQVVNEEQADPLPTRLRLAASYDVLGRWVEVPGLQGILTVELEDRWRDLGDPAVYAATEISVGSNPSVALRAGYTWGADLQLDGAGVGVGVRYDRFDLGISKSLASGGLVVQNEPIHFGLGFVFH
ncbi:MAG: hypothetical protein P8188_08890 [Gemmatimonadota bacterium]|jgi:hypothetical protein